MPDSFDGGTDHSHRRVRVMCVSLVAETELGADRRNVDILPALFAVLLP